MKTVLVTGAAGGIGQALVCAFSRDGYRVIALDLAEGAPDDLPCDAFIACDLNRTVEDEAYATEAFARVRRALGDHSLHCLINNAAIQIQGDVETLDRRTWHATFNVNVLAPFLWAQAFLPELEDANGMVLNISSIHAHLTKQGFVAYATSKAALSGMTRAMAVELGGRVRVNGIEPAAIRTPMLEAGFSEDAGGYAALERFHPVGSIGSPEDLAALACSIARLPGNFLNGSLIAFDGGIGGALHDPGARR